MQNDIKACLNEARLLNMFKVICEKNFTAEKQQRLRNVYYNTSNALSTTMGLITYSAGINASTQDAKRIQELVMAFLNKKPYRAVIPPETKKRILIDQNNKCAICDCMIDSSAHVDHIVPFKYVGDELMDNYQMLCSKCNQRKNASIDYQIRYLLGTI